MPLHLPDGDLRRCFRRVAVHARADGRKADGAHRALVGQCQALAVADAVALGALVLRDPRAVVAGLLRFGQGGVFPVGKSRLFRKRSVVV